MINGQALKDRLQFIAKEKSIPYNACWKQLLLERFLIRLAHSSHASNFIFKGGFLLSYLLKIGRETTDLDFLLKRIDAHEKNLKAIFETIIAFESLDGFTFKFDSVQPLNQPHMDYPGYRIILNTSFEKMKDKIQIDVGVGDAVQPVNREIPLIMYRGSPLFEKAISLLAYPGETIFSEKLETLLSKGPGNSRMKDYHDLLLLIRNRELINLVRLKEAISSTFSNRGTQFRPLTFDETSLISIQELWVGHLRGLGENAQNLNLPEHISILIKELNTFVHNLSN